ncbi:hypothetical protein VTO73DRAFT_13754 [Trametes versicolor]
MITYMATAICGSEGSNSRRRRRTRFPRTVPDRHDHKALRLAYVITVIRTLEGRPGTHRSRPRPEYCHKVVQIWASRLQRFRPCVYFQSGFQFAKGNQLLGLVGGEKDVANMGCDWAPPINRQFCLSSGLLWGADGAGVLTAYVPPGAQPLEPVAPLLHPAVLGVPDSQVGGSKDIGLLK